MSDFFLVPTSRGTVRLVPVVLRMTRPTSRGITGGAVLLVVMVFLVGLMFIQGLW